MAPACGMTAWPILAALITFIAAMNVTALGSETEFDDKIRAIRQKLNNDEKFRQEVTDLALKSSEKTPLRVAAAKAIVQFVSEKDGWGNERDRFKTLLFSPDLPVEVRGQFADGLGRAIRSELIGVKPTSDELRKLSEGAPADVKAVLLSAADQMQGKPVTELRSDNVQFADELKVVPAKLANEGEFQTGVNAELIKSLLAQAQAAMQDSRWDEGRQKLAQVANEFPGQDATVQRVLNSFLAQREQAKLTREIADEFLKFVSANLKPKEMHEAASVMVAQRFFQEGAFDDALKAAQDFSTAYPQSKSKLQIELIQGLVYSRTQKREQAMTVFEKLAKEKAFDMKTAQRAQLLIGWTYLIDKDNAKARDALKAVIANYDDSEYTGKARELLGRLEVDKK